MRAANGPDPNRGPPVEEVPTLWPFRVHDGPSGRCHRAVNLVGGRQLPPGICQPKLAPLPGLRMQLKPKKHNGYLFFTQK